MKYPQTLHLEIPLSKLKIERRSLILGLKVSLSKLIRISRDPNHPRAGVSYRLCDSIEYDNHVELVLKRVYPQPKCKQK